MIREIIVTSPQGVRLAFESAGEQGLEVRRAVGDTVTYIHDRSKPIGDGTYVTVGIAPADWLIELNENVT